MHILGHLMQSDNIFPLEIGDAMLANAAGKKEFWRSLSVLAGSSFSLVYNNRAPRVCPLLYCQSGSHTPCCLPFSFVPALLLRRGPRGRGESRTRRADVFC